jgi:hypothetical protein
MTRISSTVDLRGVGPPRSGGSQSRLRLQFLRLLRFVARRRELLGLGPRSGDLLHHSLFALASLGRPLVVHLLGGAIKLGIPLESLDDPQYTMSERPRCQISASPAHLDFNRIPCATKLEIERKLLDPQIEMAVLEMADKIVGLCVAIQLARCGACAWEGKGTGEPCRPLSSVPSSTVALVDVIMEVFREYALATDRSWPRSDMRAGNMRPFDKLADRRLLLAIEAPKSGDLVLELSPRKINEVSARQRRVEHLEDARIKLK